MPLSPKKELAAKLLSQGYNQAETARDKRINVTKQTMNAWYKDEEFQDKIKEYQTDLFKQAEEVFARNVSEAADAIVEIATRNPVDEKGKPIDHRLISSKLKAALFIIERTIGKKPVSSPTTSIKEDTLEEVDIDEEELDRVLEFGED